jgi:glutathione S-transferase
VRPILHHYPNSPFAEKIRTLLGFKKLDWTSVLIPSIMPKPDVIALTGGYRKTPILQLGADIYCDTALIAKVIEDLAPLPTIYPEEQRALASILAQWADSTLFWTAIPYTMQPSGFAYAMSGQPAEVQKAFAADRATFRGTMPRLRIPEATAGLKVYLDQFEALLGDGRSWLLGESLSIADFSVYHSIWFVARGGPPAAILEGYERVGAWRSRMQAIGHGNSERLDSADAVALAARSTHAKLAAGEFIETHGLAFGSPVTIAAIDYGCDPVSGELVLSRPDEIGLVRTDPRAGTVVVHFPRIGFEIKKAEAA